MLFQASSRKHWLRFGLLGLLIACLLGGAMLYLLVDSRKVANLAVSTVERMTGRSLAVNGPLALKIFPSLAVVAEDVVLGNAPWAADPVMVKVERAAFSIEWLPLLRQNISIDRVQLNGVTLNLQKAPVGQVISGNWDLPIVADITTKDGSGIEGFNLQSLELADVAVTYRDASESQAQSIVVDRLRARVSASQIDFEGRVRWQQQPLDLNGRVLFRPDVPLNFNLALKADRLDLKTGEDASRAASVKESPWMFDTQTLGFTQLPQWNGSVEIAIKTLVLPNGIVLPNMSSRALLDAGSDGVLTLDRFSAGLGQGVVHAGGRISAYASTKPRVTLRGHAEGFSLDKVIAQTSPNQKPALLQGGPAEFAFNLDASGTSLRELFSSMNGELQLSIGAARVSSVFLNAGGDFVLSVFDAVNPMRKASDTTQLECAVAYLPVRNGLLTIARSVGVETDRLNVILDGQINLHNESLNIRIYPSEKSGLTTGVNAGGLVQIIGSLQKPRLGINKTGVVTQAASVGLAVFTAGISLAAQNVASIAMRRNPCQNVLKPWPSIDGDLATR